MNWETEDINSFSTRINTFNDLISLSSSSVLMLFWIGVWMKKHELRGRERRKIVKSNPRLWTRNLNMCHLQYLLSPLFFSFNSFSPSPITSISSCIVPQLGARVSQVCHRFLLDSVTKIFRWWRNSFVTCILLLLSVCECFSVKERDTLLRKEKKRKLQFWLESVFKHFSFLNFTHDYTFDLFSSSSSSSSLSEDFWKSRHQFSLSLSVVITKNIIALNVICFEKGGREKEGRWS